MGGGPTNTHVGRRPPGRPRQADLEVPTPEAIVRAAADLFMTYGYRSVTIDMVAEVVAASHHVFDQARRGTELILARPAPLRARLTAIAEVVLALPHPFTAYDTLVHEASFELSDEALREIRTAEQTVATIVEQAIIDAAAAGDLVTSHPVLVAHAFIALLRVGQTRTVDGRPRFPDIAATARVLVDTLWDGVGPASP
jgi:TetR/AcrR family transcriptional repressor of mexJK operon